MTFAPFSSYAPPLSFWEREHYFQNLDVLIVGCGIVGLNAAIHLLEQHPEWKILIIDQGKLPQGASTKNAGFACFGSPTELLDDLEHRSPEQVFGLFARRYQGIQALKKRNSSFDIQLNEDGGYEVFDSTTLKDSINEDTLNYLNTEIEKHTGLDEYFSFRPDLLDKFGLHHFDQLIFTPHESSLNPMKMIAGLINIFQGMGGRILFSTSLTHWEDAGHQVHVTLHENLKFTCRKLIFAVNGFAPNLLPHLEVQSARNQVLVLKTDVPLKIKGCFHFHKGYVYFRNVGEHLLIGGGRHLDITSENTLEWDFNPTITNYLIAFAERHLLQNIPYRITDHWTGILGLGPEKKPIIEMISPSVAVAVRMGGMGVAIGTLVGQEVAELILLKK
jgi:gamma-glutamylputrescine oxidase